MGFTLDDENVDVSVPNKKVKSNGLFGGGNFKDLDADIPDVTFSTPKGATDLKLGFPQGGGVIRKGARIIKTSGDRRRSRNKTFGIKGTPIKDGVRVIRKAGKRR